MMGATSHSTVGALVVSLPATGGGASTVTGLTTV